MTTNQHHPEFLFAWFLAMCSLLLEGNSFLGLRNVLANWAAGAGAVAVSRGAARTTGAAEPFLEIGQSYVPTS